MSRGCALSDLVCIDVASNLEIKIFAGKASLERSVAAKLRAGKCKTAMLNRAASYNKHAVDVRKAKAAWRARDYVLAGRRYEADFAQGEASMHFSFATAASANAWVKRATSR